jgi:hypothetical protein
MSLCRQPKVAQESQAPFGIALFQTLIKREVGGRRLLSLYQPWAIEDQWSTGRQEARRTIEQAERRSPRADMDHVDAQNRDRLLNRPLRILNVNFKRRSQIAWAVGLPRGDGRQRVRIRITRLPIKGGKAIRKCERMFPSSARNLEDQATRWQPMLQNIPDWHHISRDCRGHALRARCQVTDIIGWQARLISHGTWRAHAGRA